MPSLNLKPTHKAVTAYYEALAKFAELGDKHETAVRSAFQELLEHCARQFDRKLVPEYAIKRKGKPDAIADGALLDFDLNETQVSQAIISNARAVILVADSSKFGRTAPARFASLRDVDVFVTDRLPSLELKQLCAREDVRVIETAADENPASVFSVTEHSNTST